jgi:nicotinate-nucleotide adenylyltransferase
VRVGILGGTFNPPHIAHLVCAQEARAALGLDRVLLVPAGVPPHKEVPDDPGAAVRVALCRLAAAGDPGVEVSEVETEREGPSWTVDTLRELHAREPEHELTFILGGDMAVSLGTWREPEEIVRLARLAVAERGKHSREEVARALGTVPGAAGRTDVFSMPRLEVSSSDLRGRVRAGAPIRHLVPDAVAEYIASEGLYR